LGCHQHVKGPTNPQRPRPHQWVVTFHERPKQRPIIRPSPRARRRRLQTPSLGIFLHPPRRRRGRTTCNRATSLRSKRPQPLRRAGRRPRHRPLAGPMSFPTLRTRPGAATAAGCRKPRSLTTWSERRMTASPPSALRLQRRRQKVTKGSPPLAPPAENQAPPHRSHLPYSPHWSHPCRPTNRQRSRSVPYPRPPTAKVASRGEKPSQHRRPAAARPRVHGRPVGRRSPSCTPRLR
jgi:hypothetical protein